MGTRRAEERFGTRRAEERRLDRPILDAQHRRLNVSGHLRKCESRQAEERRVLFEWTWLGSAVFYRTEHYAGHLKKKSEAGI